jgi:ParB-like chromosome segregation protein Spo0J
MSNVEQRISNDEVRTPLFYPSEFIVRYSIFCGLLLNFQENAERMGFMEMRTGESIRVDLGKLAENPGPYTMSYGFDLDVLCESLRKIGLINPPLVCRNEQGFFDVVSGHRRILALKALGESQALCRDVTSELPTSLERVLAGFYENLATRKFNDIEKAMVLAKLRDHSAEEKILGSYMPLLSLPSHRGTLKFYLTLLHLDHRLKTALAREEISIKAVKALLELEQAAQQTLIHWIDMLKLNFNHQVQFIEYCSDISKREETTIIELLNESSFRSVPENPRLNNPQKAKAMLEALRTRRFPRLARARSAVERALAAVSMPPETSIRYDPFLEDPHYRLEIKFRNGRELKKTIGKLHASDNLEAMPELWATE